MHINKKGFTLVELFVVITIMIILVGFGFSKLSNFFVKESTLGYIEDINRNILKLKINSQLDKSSISLYFTKKMPYFYSAYTYVKSKGYNLYPYSGFISQDQNLMVDFVNDGLFSTSGILVIDNEEQNLMTKNVYFNGSGVTASVNITTNDIEKNSLYLKNQNDLIITGKLHIYKNSTDNSIFISEISGKDFSNNQLSIDSLQIVNSLNGKYQISSVNSGTKTLLKEAKVFFKDMDDNGGYLYFYN